jgi:hypothetical protein
MFRRLSPARARLGRFESITIDLLAGYLILIFFVAGGAFLMLRDVDQGVIHSRTHGDIWYVEQPFSFALHLTGGVVGALIPAGMTILLALAVMRRLAGLPGGLSLRSRYRKKRATPEPETGPEGVPPLRL